MPSDTKNVKLGVCQIKFGGYDLGYTKGGVEIDVKTETKKIMVDQFGNSEINEQIIGRTVSIKAPLAESTLYNIAEIMPGSSLSLSGGSSAIAGQTITALAAGSVTINGVTFTGRASQAAVLGPREFYIGTSLAQLVATLAARINSAMDAGLANVMASSANNVLVLTAATPGATANSYTFSSTFTGTVTGFSGGVDPGRAKLTVGNGTSVSLLASAMRLVLHPIANANDDRSGDFIVPLAATSGEFSVAYKLDEERIYSANFTGYPDSSTGVLFVVGDESA